jgi:hypothetical protein
MDLLVGDPFGDVLHLQGKGDGSFQVAGNRASLSVQQLGNGKQDVLLANQQSDRITIQAPTPGSTNFTPVATLADGSHSTLAPGTVQWAKLDRGSPFYDAVVVASGGNQILVYRGTGFDANGNPTFAAPVSYPVGTNPVAVTIQDINGDGVPDMIVANQGSNDVSILFGSWDASGHWWSAGVGGDQRPERHPGHPTRSRPGLLQRPEPTNPQPAWQPRAHPGPQLLRLLDRRSGGHGYRPTPRLRRDQLRRQCAQPVHASRGDRGGGAGLGGRSRGGGVAG